MKVSFLGPGASESEIKSRLSDGWDFAIAIAFLKNDGLEAIRKYLVNGMGKIVVGTSSFYITDWKALKGLKRLSINNSDLHVKRYHNTAFHPKVFFFGKGDLADVIIGSSNLTLGGLTSNVEANVLVQGIRSEPFFAEVQSFLNTLFRAGVSLDEDFIRTYKKKSLTFRRSLRRDRFDHELKQT